MKTRFSFLDFAEIFAECVDSGISKKKDREKYIGGKILQGPSRSIRVLEFVDGEDKDPSVKHFEGILIAANIEYKHKAGFNLPLVISNIKDEELSSIEEAKQLRKHVKQHKWLIPVVNNYGKLATVLGASDEIKETLRGCLEEGGSSPIQANARRRQVDKELIALNKWLQREDKSFCKTAFSVRKVLNDMTIHVMKNNLDAIQKGHFELQSGKHVSKYISPTALFSKPKLTEWMARLVYARFDNKPIDCIVTYSFQTSILATALKEEFEKNGISVECLMMEDYTNPYLRHSPPHFKKFKDKKTLVITDVSSTGQLLERIANIIKSDGGRIQALATIVETNPYKGHFKRNYFYVCRYKVDLFDAPCPACRGADSKRLYYIDPRTNAPFLSSGSHREYESVASGNEENKAFWKMVKKTDALKIHVLLGEGERHYYYYIDTYTILNRYIDEIPWNVKCWYGEDPMPHVILFPSNPSALMIARHLIRTEFPSASLIPADKTGDVFNVGSERGMKGKNILIVDDGANTGRTLCGLLNLCMRVNENVKNVKVCIFIDRLSGEYRDTVVGKIRDEKIKSIYRMPIPSYIDERRKCPLCIEVGQLKKHYKYMSLAAQTYVDNRLKKIRAKEMQEDDSYVSRDEKSRESTISRAKALDLLYGKGENAFLEALRYKTPLEKLVRVLEAIPAEYVRMRDVKPWLESQLTNIEDISYLTKSLRMWLNADPGTIVKHLSYVIKQFAKTRRNRFLAYLLEYLVYEGAISREDLTGLLTQLSKEVPEQASFLMGTMNSVIFRYPEEIRLRPSLIPMYHDTFFEGST